VLRLRGSVDDPNAPGHTGGPLHSKLLRPHGWGLFQREYSDPLQASHRARSPRDAPRAIVRQDEVV
jgi:hypothetical protein